MTATECLPLTSESAMILTQPSCRHAFCDAVKGKFGCAAVIHNVDFTTVGSNNGAIVPEIKYSKQLPKGVKISVWKDDLTTHKVDAVVNAANERLNHGGGLARALSRAGGPQIQQQSDQITNVKGWVPTGEAVVTPAGKLPCQYIIHAVGPCVPPNPSKREISAASPLLEKAIQSIFQLTEHNNLQSVAIPAISSGLYNFPLDLCADIIVNSVSSFIDARRPQSGSLEIRLVNHDDPSVHEMLRACKKFLGPPDSQSGAVQTQRTSSPKSGEPSLELENVTLHLKNGCIEEETVDVIVNTIAKNLDLSKGLISRAILDKAGFKIQQEIRRNRSGQASDGAVFITSGPNLNCKAVYHTVCAHKDAEPHGSQILHRVVTYCLEKADSQGHSSISFPAIGTGNLGFNEEEVSHIMIEAVVQFARKHKGKKLDVYFVIFPTDTDKFQAFTSKIDSIKRTFSRTTDKSSAIHVSDEASGTPFIELSSESKEALREAKAWTVKILHATSQFTINNNHVVQFGQEDHVNLMSLQNKFHVHITGFFRDGKCGITIIGEPTNVSSAALEVEAMLCQAQEDFAQAEENDLLHSVVCWKAFPGSEQPDINAALEKSYLAGAQNTDFQVNGQNHKIDFKLMRVETENKQRPIERICILKPYSELPKNTRYYAKKPIDKKNYRETRPLERCGLTIERVEEIKNYALGEVFELTKKRIQNEPERLYQRVTAQFCELICRVGFQREYAPPEEQRYGAGIYFTKDVEDALKLWTDDEEVYVYIIAAKVLTGKSTRGSPQMIVPPHTGTDPLVSFNSLTNVNKDIYVIFNGQQALPEYIITCTKPRQTGV